MRVLWFTNIPLSPVNSALGLPGKVIGGWMDSLRTALQRCADIELGVASFSDFDYECLYQEGTAFYNIRRPSQKGSFGAVIRRWSPTVDISKELSDCLRIIEEFHPDLIHIHGSEEFYGLIAKETSVPVVISLQGILTACEKFFFGGMTYRQRIDDIFSLNFLRGTALFHDYRKIKNAAIRERQIIKICKYFIGRTSFDKNFISILNPNSKYYYGDEILRSPFYSSDWTFIPSDQHIIYCITSPAPYKGLDYLLKACRILKDNGFPNIQLRISGQIKNSEIWGPIKKEINRLSLSEVVTWLGTSPAEIIASELKNANVFVLPSYIENSPNSLAEAMAVGTPCVASYAGGVPSMICHGKDGLLFQAGDAYSMAGMIANILRDPALAMSLSENAKASARKRHDPQRNAQNYMNIYRDINDDFNSNEGSLG